MKLTTKTRYGTRLLIDLAQYQHEGAIQISAIANRQDISIKYLEQLIRPLKKANLVISKRGAKGGYMLAEQPEKITLGRIFRLFEGDTGLVECIHKPETCKKTATCQIRCAWERATLALYKELDSISLADLMVESD